MGTTESTPHQKQQRIKEYAEELERSEAPQDENNQDGGDQNSVKGDNPQTQTQQDAVDGSSVDDTADAEDQFQFTGDASQSDPKKLRFAYMRSHSIVDATDMAALQIDPTSIQYPFENIIMEGGGNKGLAYVGAVKCLEELGMMHQIKRIGGTSAGAITAALVAFGYSSDEVLEFLSQDIESVFMDHSCGYFSLLPNLVRKFGWNPGNKIHEWFGQAIKEKTGDPDSTFGDLYTSRGVELCIVVTNLSLMSAQYCHAKTTPNMPIRDALRMTMAIPGVFSAIHYDNHGVTDVYVDGGVLVNYPISCFDGWFLSMAKTDAFLNKLKCLANLPEIMAPNNRFKATGPNKTIGFLLFADAEREIMRFDLEKRIGALHPEKPSKDTALWLTKEKKKRDQEIAQKSHRRIVLAVDNFLTVLSGNNDEDPEFISKEELRAAFNDESFLQEHKELLFGKECNLDKAFDILDKDKNNKIAFYEVIQFIEERGIRMQVRFQGYNRREVDSFPSFLVALQETVLTNMKYTAVSEEDAHRTVGINTGHIGTMDYKLEEADRQFIVERGYNSTMSFLRYYVLQHPDDVKPRPVPSTVQNQQPVSIQHSSNGHSNNNNSTVASSEKDGLLKGQT